MKRIFMTALVFLIFITAKAQTVTIDQPGSDSGKMVTAVEGPPEFPGGLDGFTSFLVKNLRYPRSARRKNIQGKVMVSFTVEKDGTISNLWVSKSVSPELDDEALRVMRLSPNWRPGMQNGKLVAVKYAVPINFSLK